MIKMKKIVFCLQSIFFVFLYTNNLKSWEFGKEAPQSFCLERATIAERQGASEDRNFEAEPTQPKTNSSSCLCILSSFSSMQGNENSRSSAAFRDYNRPLSSVESKEVRYILKTLATKSLTGLLKCRSDLERAGSLVENIHPLQFLLTVFTDEELKVYMHNIKKRGSWIWGEFIKGLKRSLQEESGRGNLTPEMLENFVSQLQIPLSLIDGLIANCRWEEFVKTLITEIPREGDPGRYDQ